MGLYGSTNIAKPCRLRFGRDMAGLVDGWTQFLSDHPAKRTQAELDHTLADVLARHGVSVKP